MNKEMIDFQEVTETSNSFVSEEQIDRMENRYNWAASLCKSKDIIEVACGTGQGLSILYPIASSIKACDISEKMIAIAKENYPSKKMDFFVSDAIVLPFDDNSADIILLFEAIYYIEDIGKLMDEIKRVLRPNGELLISTANCDLYDFNPSPFSIKYFGAKNLYQLLNKNKFTVELYGDYSLKNISLIQKLFRIIKYITVKMNMIPKTMTAKIFFKKLVFGNLVEMPNHFSPKKCKLNSFDKISNEPNIHYKVILARAVLLTII
jgi:ubiquinone/menaquinone biosynthesis C-methylase UbiE